MALVNTIIFDMDGTLFQTNKILEKSLHDTFNELKKKGLWNEVTPIEKYREIMGVPLEEVWKVLLPNGTDQTRIEANHYFQDKLMEHIVKGNGALYTNADRLLANLQQSGYTLFIASNGQQNYLNSICEFYQLNRWVKEVFSIESIASQDKGDLVKTIIKKYNLKEAIVVGDRSSDFNAASANGFQSIGCCFDFAKEEELVKANYIVNDLLEIEDILLELNGSQA
ncbi:NIF family HAD-type phosphatase [Aquibacillus kalidii]|uniref:NIF family HAD-type phosphatase n=1 Tax=Aquibacillus kalidii TaxID=2762597 RepID=UPI001645B7BA|nr:NIF family HAD-type phosphatase [Aquibacillus kalidii]